MEASHPLSAYEPSDVKAARTAHAIPQSWSSATLPPAISAAGPFALAALVTGLPLWFHLASTPAGVAMCFVLGATVAYRAPQTIPIVILFSYMFQNLFVALLSPYLEDLSSFNAARGYNFVLTVAVWLVIVGRFWLKRSQFDTRLRSIIDVTTIVLVMMAIYFAIGFIANGSNAITYLRNISVPILLFQIFAVVFSQYDVKLSAVLLWTALAAASFGYAEVFSQDQLLQLVNGDTYLNIRLREGFDSGAWLNELRERGFVVRDYRDMLRTEFLNSPLFSDWQIVVNRLVGPNFHSISFAYALAFLALVLLATGRWWFALLVVPLLLIIGSKGALVYMILVATVCFLPSVLRRREVLFIYVGVLLLYAASGIVVGMRIEDYHVLGFLGGLKGFLNNPFGHGIGSGGNLSGDVTALNWSQFQHQGETDVAVESGVGVLLFQMGICGLFLLGTMTWLAVKLWGLHIVYKDRLMGVGAIALLTIMVNGIFQEEALFAPLAFGFASALMGLLLGRAYKSRTAPAQFSRANRAPSALSLGAYTTIGA
jgi:hypothetical protein